MRHTFLVVTVKGWLKSVYIYGSYRKIKTGVPLFLDHSVFGCVYRYDYYSVQIIEQLSLDIRCYSADSVHDRLGRNSPLGSHCSTAQYCDDSSKSLVLFLSVRKLLNFLGDHVVISDVHGMYAERKMHHIL